MHVHVQGLLFIGSVKLSCGGRTEFWCGMGTGYGEGRMEVTMLCRVTGGKRWDYCGIWSGCWGRRMGVWIGRSVSLWAVILFWELL